jgi:hypothetical protein
MKIPAIISCSLLCFALGAAAGVAGITIFGYKLTGVRVTMAVDHADKRAGDPAGAPGKGGPPAGMMGKGGGGMMGKGGKGKGGPGGPGPGGGPGDMMAMMMGGKGKGASPKSQLESLIVKLDLLTQKLLKIELSKEQAKKVGEEVRELAKADLTDDDAKKHLDRLLEVLGDQKETLTAAGFRWPSAQGDAKGGPGGGGAPVDMEKHLKSLQQRLDSK